MKKRFSLCLFVALTFLLSASAVFAATPNYPYLKNVQLPIGQKTATVNGVAKSLDQAAFIKNGRTLVPFRFLAESLGAQVSWDGAKNTAGLTLQDKEVKVTVGSQTAYINGTGTALEVPAENKGGRIFIPLRFVSEALGADVDYDSETKTVSVVQIDKTGWKALTLSDNITFSCPTDWTVSGDLNTGLSLSSPFGTKVKVSAIADAAKVLADKKAEYTAQGYSVIEEGPADENSPDTGTIVALAKADLQNVDNSDIALVMTVKWDTNTLLIEMSTKIQSSDDMAVVEKIFE